MIIHKSYEEGILIQRQVLASLFKTLGGGQIQTNWPWAFCCN
jgi:hypothetical protein